MLTRVQLKPLHQTPPLGSSMVTAIVVTVGSVVYMLKLKVSPCMYWAARRLMVVVGAASIVKVVWADAPYWSVTLTT